MHSIPLVVILRRIILVTLLVLPQRFWFRHGWELASRLRWPALRLIGQSLLVLSGVAIALVLYDRIFARFLPGVAAIWIAPVVQLWIFASAFAFLCVKAVHGMEWLWVIVTRSRTTVPDVSPSNSSRRSFFRYAASIAGTLPFVAATCGYTRERLRFEIVRVDVPVSNLPPALNGFRIVQLSDIHIGDFMPQQEVRRAVDMANSLAPHLAVVTGDFVSSQGDPLAECIAELSRLEAPLGIWGCNGSHEIYADADDEAEALFSQHGMKLLRQTAAQLNWNGERLNLIGVDYQRDLQLTGSTLPTLDGVEQLVRRDMVNVLLSHNPNTFYRAADLGIELSLAGHTHGGQVNVEILDHSLSLARFMTKFIAGLYQLPMSPNPERREASVRPSFLYVNRGIGTLAVPARLGADPEITLLTLRSA